MSTKIILIPAGKGGQSLFFNSEKEAKEFLSLKESEFHKMLINGTSQKGYFVDYAICDEHGFVDYGTIQKIDESVKKFFILYPERKNFKLKDWILKHEERKKQKKNLGKTASL